MNDENKQIAYGKEQNIKIDLMQMINEGRSPYEIIFHIAEYLEKISGEAGYAGNVRECINSIYGLGLSDEKPLTDELEQIHKRCKKLEIALDEVDNEEIKKRIGFAVEHHKKYAAFLEEKIKKNTI